LTPGPWTVQIARAMPDEISSSGKTRRFPRSKWVQVGLLVSSVVILAAVLGSILIWSGGDDAQVASATRADKRPVKVIIAGTNDAKEEVTDGGIVGEGTFSASGAIRDRGTVTAYRGLSVLNEGVILLRFVTKGRDGAITYMVKIDTTRRPVISRWTIESGTRAYKGLRGKGTETENRTYTVSTLRGKVWH
jgi:hypothetical protein